VINASVEFDIETLSPTYKLLIGVPGRSNAFEISKRLGLMETVIDRAKGHISSETNTIENMIASLEKSRKQAEAELAESEQIRREAETLHKELQNQIIQFNNERDQLFEKAEQKAADSIEKATAEAEEVIREL